LMLPDLQRVITLQRLDSTAQDAQRRLAEQPERERAFEARLDVARQKVADAKNRLTESQNARRLLEKEVAVHQGRLSKFRDQLMAVKTNQEYQAMQKEIEFAQAEVKGIEDKVLERMLEADDLSASLKRAEAELAKEQKSVEADRRALAAELADLNALVERAAAERAELVSTIDPQVMAVFELVARRRNGVAVAEARDGICTICHVRLRPQLFNNVRRNDAIVQCENCQRILYFVPSALTETSEASVNQPAH
jgi:predicted  nucleic acid-binding Zn-ribbon protein